MIDIHCHVLPNIDDGCRNMQTALEVLEASRKQGIDTIIATPHFYASRDRIENFITKRNTALENISREIKEKGGDPRLFCGSEVAYFNGISRAEGIEQLTIEGTNILLLEMPTEDWQSSYIDEIRALCTQRGLKIIIAHMERYLYRRNRQYTDQLLDLCKILPIRIQINAKALLDRRQSRSILKMFQKGQAHFLASDCHGMHRRPPNLGEGRAVIEQKLGSTFLTGMDQENRAFLEEAGFKKE